jgi:hypothetical protein
MYPSYPSYTRHTNLSIRFAVPDQHVVMSILRHCEDENNMRFRAAGNTLYPRVRQLARLMSRHRIQLATINTHELSFYHHRRVHPLNQPWRSSSLASEDQRHLRPGWKRSMRVQKGIYRKKNGLPCMNIYPLIGNGVRCT